MRIRKLKNTFAEWLNRVLYESKGKAYVSVRSITFLSSLVAMALLIYSIGFELTPYERRQVFYGLDIIFGIFVLTYLVRWLYSFRRADFLDRHRFEGFLMLTILVNGISGYIFGYHLVPEILDALGAGNSTGLYQAVIAVFMFLLLVYEFVVASQRVAHLNLRPAAALILSFILLITLGTGLLMLPNMTIEPGGMPFLKALFTSVSACCVTGLIVVDTATYFTLQGQITLLILIQLGGLGILSFATFFTLFLREGVGIRHQVMLQDFLSSESLMTARGLLRHIITLTFLIEFIGFIFVYLTWGDVPFASTSQKVFFSIFHAVSAFCNAGFSLYSNGLYEVPVRTAYVLHIVIAGLVILGGIGFPVIADILSPSRLRYRFNNPWKDWELGTKIAVYVSAALLAVGTIGFYFLERNNTLAGQNFMEALITSFFQSTITRTAGFNTIDFSAIGVPTVLMCTFLMFIGASSGSIGGGIKTSTFFLISASAIATVRGKMKIEIGRKFISNNLVFRALSIFVFAVGYNIIATFILTITEPGMNFMDLFFEQVSAFGTVGLSTGITAQLSEMSQIVIIMSMFIGRIGTLTFVLAFSSRVISRSYRYPKAHLMVG